MVFRCRRRFATCDNERKLCHLIIREANKNILHYTLLQITSDTDLAIGFFSIERYSRYAAMKKLFSKLCHLIISEANLGILHDILHTDYYLVIWFFGVE